jgi:hypothetical protein
LPVRRRCDFVPPGPGDDVVRQAIEFTLNGKSAAVEADASTTRLAG